LTAQRREPWGPVLSLALLAVLTSASWLLTSVSLFSEDPERSAEQDDLVAVIYGAVIRRTDREGNPYQELRSERAELLRSAKSNLVRPIVTVAPPGSRAMRLSADHATINSQRTEVSLRGGVQLFQESSSSEPFVRVTTETLFFSSVENVARTSEPVRVTRGRSELHGVGMVARTDTGQVTILADTRMVMPSLGAQPKGNPR